ncbi:hypothetical protein D3C72_1973450 [compost metagenome]
MVPDLGAELVISDVDLIAQKAKIAGLNLHAPIPRLGTERAVALGRAGIEVEVGLVTHDAAVATAFVSPLGHSHFSLHMIKTLAANTPS